MRNFYGVCTIHQCLCLIHYTVISFLFLGQVVLSSLFLRWRNWGPQKQNNWDSVNWTLNQLWCLQNSHWKTERVIPLLWRKKDRVVQGPLGVIRTGWIRRGKKRCEQKWGSLCVTSVDVRWQEFGGNMGGCREMWLEGFKSSWAPSSILRQREKGGDNGIKRTWGSYSSPPPWLAALGDTERSFPYI